MNVYQYEVWYEDGKYYLDYCTGENLSGIEFIFLHRALRFRFVLTNLTELPPF